MLPNEPKYPNVTVRVPGKETSDIAIIARVRAALRKAGVSEDEIDAFTTEATTGDDDQLLRTVTMWVTVV